MARNWPALPAYDTEHEAASILPDGWKAAPIESLYEQLPLGKRFEQKSTNPTGITPVIDQSAEGIIGWHNEPPGVSASHDSPVVTFANHTCEMRLMRRPFSVIQNVFPLIGNPDRCTTSFLYYGTKGRVRLEEYKGHYPDFRRKWISLPPIDEQRAIANILGTLDDKIELNRRMNETLEEMAQALFKSWFVDFDPVCAKADGRKPRGMDADTAKLFPSEFEDSELGKIPKGWRMGTLGSIAGLLSGYAFKSKDWTDSGVPVVKIGSVKPGIVDLSASSYVPVAIAADAERYKLFVGDLLIGMTGYVGEVGLVPYTPIPPLLNQRVGRIILQRRGTAGLAFVYCLMRRPEFKLAVESRAHGTAQPNVSGDAILSIPSILPSPELRFGFDTKNQPLLERILENHAEIQTIAALRDTLLPKLLSGELRISDAERFLEGSR